MSSNQLTTNIIQAEGNLHIGKDKLEIIAKSDSSAPVTDQLANQELIHQFREGKRGEDYRSHIHRLVVVGMYVIGMAIICMIFIRVWHFLSPKSWHWLTEKENQDIERIIFGTVFISVLGKYFKKYNIIDNNLPQ